MPDGAILGQKAITLPTDTTANRPTPTQGMFRYNTSLNQLEYYTGTAWVQAEEAGTGVALAIALG